MNVTIFRNLGDIASPHTITLTEALDRIRSGRSKTKVEAIRKKLFLGEDYSADKKDLPSVEFSAAKTQAVTNKKGNLTHREDASVVEHSGVFILDFDNCDVELKKEQLRKDTYIFSCWTGPSGAGVKALVKCPPNVQQHDLYYTAFLERYPELDATSRNVSRLTFESYDPDLWINEQALVWDKKLTEEERRKNKAKEGNKRSLRVLATAVAMVRSSYQGNKHDNLRNAGVLLGGYISTGRVNEEEAVKLLEEEIKLKNPKNFEQARETIRAGIDYGKSRPIHETKKIERELEFLRRSDGSYDFLADDSEMMDYEVAVVNGSLEMGLVTGINDLNSWWMFKKNHLVWFAGLDSAGKSFLLWYLSVLAATLHGWKFLIYSSENRDGMLRKKLKEFYIGKSLKVMDDEELTIAHDWVQKHFRIMTSKQMHTVEDLLMKAEIVFDEGFEFDCFIAEPYNSLDVPRELDSHRHNLYALNRMRNFKENYASLWVCDHVGTASARNKDKEGFVMAPWKSDIEGGQVKANKVDDFLIIHRILNHPLKKYDTEIHVGKVRDRESGGHPTTKDAPVIIQLNPDFSGYSCMGVDPIKEYWKKQRL